MLNQIMKLKRGLLAGGLALAAAGVVNAEDFVAADEVGLSYQSVIDLEQHFGKTLENGVGQVSAQWRYVGKASFVDADVDMESAWLQKLEQQSEDKEVAVKDDDSLADAKALLRWNAVNVQTGDRYIVELPAETARGLRRLAEQAGWSAGNTGPASDRKEADDEGIGHLAKGWSNGVDTRTRRYNNTSYPYRAMGQIGGGQLSGCSGTLVGRRHVLTAAHCLYDIDDDVWTLGGKFRPGREGTCNNASCEPYGEYSGIWYFTPAAFRANGSDWREHDYGMMVLNGTPGNQTGWLGYVATGQGTIRDYCDKVPFGPGFLGGQCYNRGYPACGFSEAPDTYESCKQGWAYQDQNPCEIGSFYNTGVDGWASRFNSNCDISRGHSGSAAFTTVWNGSGKVVFGVLSTHSCTTCSAGQTYVNGFRRVTPVVLDMISYFKTQMP